MRVLVTGATGFVGFHCVKKLVAAGHDVRLLVRSPGKLAPIYEPHAIAIEDFVVGDMVEAEVVRGAIQGCDAVVHAAASLQGDEAVGAANIAGVRNVVGGAVEAGIDPVIYVSSIGCMFPPPGDLLTVDDPLTSLDNMYGQSKIEGERLVRDYQERGAPIATLYPAGVFGPDDPVPGDLLKGVRDSLRLAFPVTDGGISVIDARDLAEVALRCLKPGMGARRYIVGGHFVTWAEFADHFARATGHAVRRIWIPRQLMIAVGNLFDLARNFAAVKFPISHEAALYMVDQTPCDSRPVCEELGITFRPTQETVSDAIRWLYQSGHLSDRIAGRMAERASRGRAARGMDRTV